MTNHISILSPLSLLIAPFILDPNNANRLLYGAASLWRSNNVKSGTPTWSSIKASISSAVSAITVKQGTSSHVWVGHNNGNVYRSTNGTATTPSWTRRDTKLPTDCENRNVINETPATQIVVQPWRS